MTFLLKTCLFLWLAVLNIDCAKIIALLPLASKSHKNVFRPLVEELASRGHLLTVVSPFKDKKTPENLTEIMIKANNVFMTKLSKDIIEHSMKNKRQMNVNSEMFTNGTDNFFEDPAMKELFDAGKQFDLAIVSGFINDAALIAAYTLADHVVILSTAKFLMPAPTAPPTPLATMDKLEHNFPKEFEFLAKVQSVAMSVFIWHLYKYMSYGYIESSGQNHGLVLPTIDEAKKRIALNLVNADPVMSAANPTIPNTVHIGGMHCKPPKKLNEEFSDFIASSGEEGFILFSLGSVMQGTYLSPATRKEFLTAFSRLKQKVIWKFEEQMENLPSNVMVTPWTPQQDILGHPKIRLFITHGGLLSIQEAIYHGVPLIGIPIFAEQPLNVRRVVELGIGEAMEIATITAEEVYTKIQKIINTPSYSSVMKNLSAVTRDQTETPLERGVYWVEYILRHKGADHLRTSAEDIDYYKYFCLDIIATLLTSVALPIYVTRKAFRYFKRSK